MHSRPSLRLSVTILLTILAGLLAALAGILGNIASCNIPPFVILYLQYAWPVFVVVVLLGIGVSVWQVRRDELSSSMSSGKQQSSPTLVPKAVQQQNTPSHYHIRVLSNATENRAFAEKLHAGSQQQAVSCWLAPHDLKTGDKMRTQIYEAIGKNDIIER